MKTAKFIILTLLIFAASVGALGLVLLGPKWVVLIPFGVGLMLFSAEIAKRTVHK